MPEPALSALIVAWRTSLIATALFTGALAIAPYWDTALFIRALNETLAALPA